MTDESLYRRIVLAQLRTHRAASLVLNLVALYLLLPIFALVIGAVVGLGIWLRH